MNRIILNVLPPTNNQMPSIAVEVLKTYLNKNRYNNIDVIYWNHIFSDLIKLSDKEEKVESNLQLSDSQILLPFFAYIANEYDDKLIMNRVLFELQALYPFLKNLGKYFYEKKINEFIKAIDKGFNEKIEELVGDQDILLFGISAKFDAWIPGIILAKKLKELNPLIKCVIGGFENRIAAETIFNNFPVFDYAIYGEGEVPLFELINGLEKNYNNSFFGNKIPRLLARNYDKTTTSVNEDRDDSYIHLSDIQFTDYTQFISSYKKFVHTDTRNVMFPIETSRGCRWNKCNFCALNWGYLYRNRDPEHVVKEIQHNYKEFGIKEYFFVDNDVVGRQKMIFEILLKKLIGLSENTSTSFLFHADVLHLGFNKELIKKMSLAGFKSVQIGYEGITDSMLKKLRKSTTFAENLLFVKFSQQYDIELTITGLIIGLPNEKEEGIHESSRNLHYLRFFLNQKNNRGLKHNFAELMLFYDTPFWKMMTSEERKKFNQHPTNDLLPKGFIPATDELYSIFGQMKQHPSFMASWKKFEVISNYYEKTDFKYYLIKNEDYVHYLEYKNNLKIEDITFDDLVYLEVLKIANDKIVSIKEVFEKVQLIKETIDKTKLQSIINELSDKFLLYRNKDSSKIVSIINTDLIA